MTTPDFQAIRDGGLDPLAAVLRRYSFGYCAAHDFTVCEEIMVDNYALLMGDIEVRDRDGQYIPATAKVYRQYPGLGFTVHKFILGDNRAALHFSEYGHSTLFDNDSVWNGVSLYEWDGTRLTQCRVEQDYYSRRIQQKSGVAGEIRRAAHDPWLRAPAVADPATEAVARTWLLAGGLAESPLGSLDDEHWAAPKRIQLDDASVEVLDLFAAGPEAAFHVLVSGTYAGGLDDLDEHLGRPANLYASGYVTVDAGVVTDVHAVTDRLAAERRLVKRA